MAGEIFDIANKFRGRVLAGERETALNLIRQYSKIVKTLEKKLAQITDRIEAAGAAGEDISPAWLFRQERYRTLLAEVGAEMGRFAKFADAEIRRAQAKAIKLGGASATAQLAEGFGSAGFTRLPALEVENQIGFLSDGSPLAALLDQIGPEARNRVGDLLVEAVALGYNPNKTAQKIKSGLGAALSGGLTRATRIARTEQMRAYRESHHEVFSANSDILDGWFWLATLSTRTCPACLALHGTFHSLDERMASHVNCRCTQIAGIEGEASPIPERGPEWLAEQSEKFQREFFAGIPGAFEAYQAGELSLEAFTGLRSNRAWGPAYSALTTAQAKAGLGQFPGDVARRSPAGPGLTPFEPNPAPATRPGLTAAEVREKLINLESEIEAEVAELMKEYQDLGQKGRQILGNNEDLKINDLIEQTALDSIWKRQEILLKEIQSKRASRTQVARDLLSQESPAEFNINSSQNWKKVANWKEGIETFKRFIGPGWLEGKTVKVAGSRGRAYHLHGTIHVGKTGWNGRPSTIIHELGHWLELESPEIFEAVSSFLDRRTAGEAVESLKKFNSSYRRDEKTRPDKFLNPYMGKVYNNPDGRRRASEIISMGLEYFYDKPEYFAKNDPDYFDFIYNLLRRVSP